MQRGSLLDRYVLPSATSLVLIGVLVAGAAAYGSGSRSAETLARDVLIDVIVVMGLQIFVGNTGVLSLGHMGFAAIAGYSTLVLAMPAFDKELQIPDAPFGLADVELPIGAAVAIGVVVACAVAFVVGLAITRAPSITATMITVAVLFVVHALAINWEDLTAGAVGLTAFIEPPSGTWVYLAAGAAVLVARLYKSSRSGRWAVAGYEDPIATSAAGVNLPWTQMAALLLSVALVAVGAGLRTQTLGAIAPSQFYFEYTLLTLAMLIVGGKRSVVGAAVGVVIVTAGKELMLNIAGDSDTLAALPDVFLGLAVIAVMLLRPNGLFGDWELDAPLRRRLQRDRPVEEAAAAATRLHPRPEPPLTLEVRDVTVDFGGFRALEDVSVEARSDEIVGLIGPNGAGKTTLLNVITGLVAPTTGTFTLGGADLTGAPSHRIARAGLARTFQNLRLFPELSVRENVAVAALAEHRYRGGTGDIDIDGLLHGAGILEVQDRRADELDYGSSRKLELARAAALAPAFLLLDEPTSGMSDTESAAMIDQVRRVADSVGAGVIVIDHDLHFITTICDRIYVLDQGRVIAHGTPEEIRHDPQVVTAYLGTRAGTPPPAEHAHPGAVPAEGSEAPG